MHQKTKKIACMWEKICPNIYWIRKLFPEYEEILPFNNVKKTQIKSGQRI